MGGSSDSLRVRGGPGINYRSVDELEKGDTVTVLGRDGEWVRIAAPPGASLWISALYVRDLATEFPEGPGVATTSRAPPTRVWEPAPTPAVPETAMTSAVAEVPAANQTRIESNSRVPKPGTPTGATGPGKNIQYSGVIRPAGMAVWRRPSRFRLVEDDALGRPVTRCYVMGDEQALAQAEGKDVTVIGREYWVQGVRYPVVTVESMHAR